MADNYDYDRRYYRDDRPRRSRSADMQYSNDTPRDRAPRRTRDVVIERDEEIYERRPARNNRELALIPDDDDVEDVQREISRAVVRKDSEERGYRRDRDRDVAIYRDDRDRYDSDESPRRRRSKHHHSRHQSEDRRHRSSRDREGSDKKKGENGGRCWYSEKDRKDAHFLEKNFDSSYDGIIAAIAGAALGGMTAGRFVDGEHRKAKIAGSALVGAVGFNAAENWYRVFTEDEEEFKESAKRKVRHKLDKLRDL